VDARERPSQSAGGLGLTVRIEHQGINRGIVRRWSLDEGTTVVDPVLPALEAGDLVEIEMTTEEGTQYARPIRQRLSGEGPWTIHLNPPSTSIAATASDDAGHPIRSVLVIDGRPYGNVRYYDPTPTSPPVVTGLSAGPHRVAIASPNHVTRLYRVVLKDGEHRKLTAHLRLVPPIAPPK
jgi:hypothetical protein